MGAREWSKKELTLVSGSRESQVQGPISELVSIETDSWEKKLEKYFMFKSRRGSLESRKKGTKRIGRTPRPERRRSKGKKRRRPTDRKNNTPLMVEHSNPNPFTRRVQYSPAEQKIPKKTPMKEHDVEEYKVDSSHASSQEEKETWPKK